MYIVARWKTHVMPQTHLNRTNHHARGKKHVGIRGEGELLQV